MAIQLLPPGGDTSWFPVIRERAATLWRAGRTARETPLACAIQADSGAGHVSVPCALADDDQAVLDLLEASFADDDPVRFVRMLLLLLDDFLESLEDARRLLGGTGRVDPPKIVSVWTNRFAKHRQSLLVLHHPSYLFVDHPDAWRWMTPIRAATNVTDIGQKWLEDRGAARPDAIALRANDHPAVVLVPRLADFLEPSLKYYREFLKWAAARPDELAKFRTLDDDLWLQTLLDRVVPLPPEKAPSTISS